MFKCLSNVCQLFVKCLSNVCQMFVKCLSNVCQMYIYHARMHVSRSNACLSRTLQTHRVLGLSFSLSPLARFLSLSPISRFLSLSLPSRAFSQSLVSHAFFLPPSPCSFLSLYLSFSLSSHSIPSLSLSSCLSLSFSSAPSRVRGTVNGFSQTAAAFSSMIAPSLSGDTCE